MVRYDALFLKLVPDVPLRKLDEGIRLCKKHTEELINSADVLLQNHLFLSSLPFSILAMEHYGYLLMLQSSKENKKPITQSQWKKRITNHPSKLKYAYEISNPSYRINEMRIWNLVNPPEQIASGLSLSSFHFDLSKIKPIVPSSQKSISINFDLQKIMGSDFPTYLYNYENLQTRAQEPKESDLTQLASLDFVKQDVFYLNYINDWFSIHEKLDNEEQKAMANIFLISIKYDFWMYQLNSFYPHLDTSRNHAIKRHPIYHKISSLERKINLDEYKKYRKLVHKILMTHYNSRPNKIKRT